VYHGCTAGVYGGVQQGCTEVYGRYDWSVRQVYGRYDWSVRQVCTAGVREYTAGGQVAAGAVRLPPLDGVAEGLSGT